MMRYARLALVLLLVGLPTGCVTRQYVITSNPPGALVYRNGVPIGATPVEEHFVYYGKYHFRLVKDGYETLEAVPDIQAPLYEWAPFDFLAENVFPFKIRDIHRLHYELIPLRTVPHDQVRLRAEELRVRGKAIPAVPAPERPNIPPKPGFVPVSKVKGGTLTTDKAGSSTSDKFGSKNDLAPSQPLFAKEVLPEGTPVPDVPGILKPAPFPGRAPAGPGAPGGDDGTGQQREPGRSTLEQNPVPPSRPMLQQRPDDPRSTPAPTLRQGAGQEAGRPSAPAAPGDASQGGSQDPGVTPRQAPGLSASPAPSPSASPPPSSGASQWFWPARWSAPNP